MDVVATEASPKRRPFTPTDAPMPPLEKLKWNGPACIDFLKWDGISDLSTT